MKRSVLIMAAVFAMGGTLGATARADQGPLPSQQPQGSPCTVMGHRVVSVTPHWVQDINGKRTRRLVGVDIRIAAERGMTAEYLTIEAQRHIGTMGAGQPMRDCVLGVRGASIEVGTAGDGFVFHVTAADRESAEEVVRRAQLLG